MSGLAAFGAAAAGAGLDYLAQQEANKTNMRVAKKQMQWQETMSNTAHQREVEDLKKAGLNPVLSVTGGSGASTPSGSSIPVQAAKLGQHLTQGVSNVLDAKRLAQDMKASDASIALTKASAATQATQAELNASNTLSSREAAKRTAMETKALETKYPALAKRAEADLKHAQMDSEYAKYDAFMQRTSQATGAAGNLFGAGKFLRSLFMGDKGSSPKGYTRENYNAHGEHTGSTVHRPH